MDKLKKFTNFDMMKPHGEVVKVIRDSISFKLTLSGIRSLKEELDSYVQTNPGTLRIESLSGDVLWTLQ